MSMTREEFEKWKRENRSLVGVDHWMYHERFVENLFDRLAPRWISVTERLPDESQYVRVHDGRGVSDGAVKYSSNPNSIAGIEWEVWNARYWMPEQELPPLPAEKEDV